MTAHGRRRRATLPRRRRLPTLKARWGGWPGTATQAASSVTMRKLIVSTQLMCYLSPQVRVKPPAVKGLRSL